MGLESIQMKKGDSLTISFDVSIGTSLVGYAGILTINNLYDGSTFISSIGVLDGSTYTFELSYTETNINPDNYLYSFKIDNSINRYTPLQDDFIILPIVETN